MGLWVANTVITIKHISNMEWCMPISDTNIKHMQKNVKVKTYAHTSSAAFVQPSNGYDRLPSEH